MTRYEIQLLLYLLLPFGGAILLYYLVTRDLNLSLTSASIGPILLFATFAVPQVYIHMVHRNWMRGLSLELEGNNIISVRKDNSTIRVDNRNALIALVTAKGYTPHSNAFAFYGWQCYYYVSISIDGKEAIKIPNMIIDRLSVRVRYDHHIQKAVPI